MTNNVTLAELEQLVAQLTRKEQIKLIESISERIGKIRLREPGDEDGQQEYAVQIEAFLKMSDEMAAETGGDVESAQDIREGMS